MASCTTAIAQMGITRHPNPMPLYRNFYGEFMKKIRFTRKNDDSDYGFRFYFRRALLALILVAGCLSAVRHVAAQVMYGSIVGNVTDASGAMVPGATIVVTQQETNNSRTTLSNGDGGYTIPTLQAGTYRIVVSKDGFSKFTVENIALRINTTVRVDAPMSVSSVGQSIEVTAQTAQLQTDSADVHAEINSGSFLNLPQPTRTYEGLIGLMTGVAPPSASSGGTNNPARSMALEANGTSQAGTNVRIDGVNSTNPWVQYFSTAVPSIEALETVNVVTSSANADQGLVSGAAINVQVKSGTNSFHGSVYEYHEDNALKARPYFEPKDQRLPKLIDNDFGFTIGGPILKNRLFFFGSYEGDFAENGSSNIATVPTDAIRNGIMTGSPTPIYDPATGNPDGTGRTPFPNNVLTRIDPIAAKIVALIPEPNLPGLANNYFVNTPVTNHLTRIDTKFDWHTTQKLTLTGRVSDYPYLDNQGTIFGTTLGGGHEYNQDGNIYAISISGTYVASPSFVVSGTFGLTHSSQTYSPPMTNVRYGSDVLGIPGTNLGDLPAGGGIPQFNINGYSFYGYDYPALVYNDPVFQYTGNATWTKGQHTVRFGIDIGQQHMNHMEVNPTGFNFTGGVTELNGGPAANQYNSFADFLLGLPNSDTNSVQTVPWVTLRSWQFSPYVSDQWQISSKLTASVGVRWDYYPVPTRVDRGIEFYNLENNTYNICGEGPNSKTCGISVQKDLFSPRIGLAYRPIKTTVLRAGFALSPEQVSMYRDGLYSYPVDLTGNYSALNSYSAVTTLAQGIPVLQPVDISSGVIPLPPGATFITDPKHFVRGYVESYNATIEQDLSAGWFASLGYVGTHTVHQHTNYNINYGLPGGGAESQPFYKMFGITGPETVISPYESMNYNSMQATLSHRFASGYQLNAAYTWSKWLGTCCDANSLAGPQIPIPQYWRLNYAPMPGDLRHIFSLSGYAALPFGKGKPFLTNGIGAAVAGGWQLNGILSMHTGYPFSVTADGTSLNAPGSTQRADQVKPQVKILGGIGSQPWFDPDAFASVTEARFGTASFDSVRGPGFANLDLGIFRNFPIRESWILQFRAEALNTTNTPHFATPDGNVGDGSFAMISSTSPGSRTTDERFFRVGAKLSF